MAGGLHDSDEEITGINVTPLVDVVLVLLIIFMVTANYMSHKSIGVELPKAGSAGESKADSLTLNFALNASSDLYLDGRLVPPGGLDARLKEVKQQGKTVQAMIAADQKTPHGSVVKLIDTIRKNDITDFAISVESE